MHPSFGRRPGTVLRGTTRPAAVLLVLAAVTACSGQDTAKTTATGDTTRTAITLTAATTATKENLERSASQLRARAAALGLTDVRTTIQGSTITVTAPGDAGGRLTAVTRPGQLLFRPVLALAPCPTAPEADPSDPTDPLLQGTAPPELAARFAALDCAEDRNLPDLQAAASVPALAFGAAAEHDVRYKFALGPASVNGADIVGAEAAFAEQGTDGWQVRLSFNPAGTKDFADSTGRLAALPSPGNEFAIVVDGEVVSHPYVREALTGGEVVISGSFTREAAEQLASALAHQLPIEFQRSAVTTLPPVGATP
ncbi:hypothetical protein GCM10009639_49280 [Kitasatospora putterlickiae]|uniref:SecDF P1 head subdomain domain-containing protein n=1 Tax=Kitasatospora putterlickiae TaxID=221725 RepID=A0ABN1YCC0_9ACTN